jgi:hypothetical protein
MDGVDFQASVTNLTQMDRHQQDAVRLPGVNQEQNAQIARDEAGQKAIRPTQPDEAEGKKIDPKDHRRNLDKRKDRKKKERPDGLPGKSTGSGFFLDVNA